MGVPFGTTNVNIGGIDFAAVDAAGVDWLVNDITGWEGAPAPTLSVTQKVRGRGGWAGDSYDGSRHITIAGDLRSDDPSQILNAKDTLKAAIAKTDTLMTVTELGVSRSIVVRREDEVSVKRDSLNHATFSTQVVALDPRQLGTSLTASTALPSSAGGLVVPLTVPFTIAAQVVTGQVSLTNPGNEVGPVKLRIDGPVTGAVVTHGGISFAMSPLLALGVGEWLDIDMEANTVLANGQASRSKFVSSRGWSGFNPGVNTWSFTAATGGSSALLTVQATPAWK